MNAEQLLGRPAGAPDWVPDIDDDVAVARLRLMIKVVIAVSLLAWLIKGANTPDDPRITDDPLPALVVASSLVTP